MPLRLRLWPLLLSLSLYAGAPPAAASDAEDAATSALVASEEYRRLHPGYHITPVRGWLNDPVGLVQYKGVYHVFYQYNPFGAVWNSSIAWAHAASTDLAHWTRLPLALQPGPQAYDGDGAFSGSVTLLRDGTPTMLYTCASQRRARGYFFQQQCAAAPADAGDPWLLRWRKRDEVNPLTAWPLPAGGTHEQWRDPAPAWRDGDTWRTLLGGQVDCRGAAMLYESTSADLLNWSYVGLFHAQSAAAAAAAPSCSQFGDAPGGGVAWETPTAFPLPGAAHGDTWALLYGDQRSARQPWQRAAVVVGRYVAGVRGANATHFVPFGDDVDAAPTALEGGEVYAPQSFVDASGRRLLLAWAPEMPPTPARGWQGVLTLPRVVASSPDGRSLAQRPAPELAALRQGVPYTADVAMNGTGASLQLPLPRSASRGTQRELLLDVSACHADICEAGLLITSTAAGAAGPRTSVTLRVERSKRRGELVVDRTHTYLVGGLGDARPQRMAFALSPSPADVASSAQLHVFLDHSVLEAFAADVGAVVTSRIYPAADVAGGAAWGVALLDGTRGARAALRVWELGAAF